MALIKCCECGKEFSDKAVACPYCGCPTEYSIKTEVEIEAKKNSERCNDNVNVIENKITKNFYDKSDLFSYVELRTFAFKSVLPYINKELNNSITEVFCGNGDKEDVHFYIICGSRTIGIKVEIDAYPDIYNVGRFFEDNTAPSIYANEMNAKGYEFAIARIGVGSADTINFARRIFLKEDGYHFNYKNLIFVKPNSGQSNIRYSLSESIPDESWKAIAGFDYIKPEKKECPNAKIMIQVQEKKKDHRIELGNTKFWKDVDTARNEVLKLCDKYRVFIDDFERLNKLVRVIAHITFNYISVKEAMLYVCNTLDMLSGKFLADSKSVDAKDALILMRELINENYLVEKYDLDCDGYTAINYMIYLYVYDNENWTECLNAYLAATKPQDKPFGVIWKKMQMAFLENPYKFGYGKDVVDEIERLKNINSPKNIEIYNGLKRSWENDIEQYCRIHERVIGKKTLQQIEKSEEVQLRQYGSNAYNLKMYISKNFDDALEESLKIKMNYIIKILDMYQRCVGMDEVIISRQLSGKYNLFERMDDLKESKKRFSEFMDQYGKL